LENGFLEITGTTLSGNSAGGGGGGLSNRGGGADIYNSTVSGNSSGCDCGGGGITSNGGIDSPATTNLRNVTIANNTASNGPGGGIISILDFSTGTNNLGNTIVANNTALTDPDVSGAIVSQGFNLVRNRGTSTGYVASDLPNGSNPMLEALGNNGGPTQTHALMAGSPAIDKGKNFSGLATDQRGLTRPVDFDNTTYPNAAGGDGSDIGAYEVQAQSPAITSANTTTFRVGSAGTFTVTTTGVPAPTVTQTGTLPTGVTFDSATSTLSGTPAAGTGGTYPITFTASNGVGSNAVQSFTLTINQAPAITSVNTTTVTAGTAGNFNVIATGFPSPAINLTSGTLPGGVNFGIGTLAGTATAFGTFPLTFTASNGVGSNAVQSFSLVVNPSASAVKSGGKIQKNAGGGYLLGFIGNPGQQYTVQYVDFLPATSAQWNFLSFQTADANGNISITLPAPGSGVPRRFYRAIVP